MAIKAVILPPFDIQLRSEEPRRAVVSMEMILSGDYLVPHLNDWPYYNKPPLFNWFMAGVMQLGNSFEEWTVRLPGQLSFLLTAVLLFLFCRPWIGEHKALIGALFFLTGGEILFYGIIIAGQIDLFYTLLVFVQMIFLYRGLTTDHKRMSSLLLLVSYLFMALGILTKGLPSLAFQGLTIIGWWIATRDYRLLLRPGHYLGMMVALLVTGGYFYKYHLVTGEGWTYVINLYKEAAQKSGLEGESSKVLSNAVAFPFNFLKTLIPWCLLLFTLAFRDMRTKLWRSKFYRFVIVFTLANIPLYWFAGSLSLRYIYPFIPFASILMAELISHPKSRHLATVLNKLFIALLFVAALFWILGPILPQGDQLPFGLWQIFWSLTFLAISVIFWYQAYRSSWLLACLMVLMIKIQSTWVFYPLRSQDERINSLTAHVDPMFEASEGQSIYLFGTPDIYDSDASLGPITLHQVRFESPMPVSYQHLYHITKHQRSVMKFETVMRPGQYYLARESDVKEMNVDISYQFEDDWLHHQLVICKLKE